MELFLSVIGTLSTVIGTVLAVRTEMRANALRTPGPAVPAPAIAPAVSPPTAVSPPPAAAAPRARSTLPPSPVRPRLAAAPGRRVHATLLVALGVGLLVAIVLNVLLSRYYPGYDASIDDPLGTALIAALLSWLTFTLPVVAAGAIATLITGSDRSRMRLAWVFVAGSTIMEVVVVTAIAAFTQDLGGPATGVAYGASSALLTAAWLAARGWPRSTLWFGALSGVASYFVFPTPGLTEFIFTTFGSEPLGQAVFAVGIVVLEVLTIGVGIWAAMLARRMPRA